VVIDARSENPSKDFPLVSGEGENEDYCKKGL